MYLVGILERRPVLSDYLTGTLPEELWRQMQLCPADALPAGRTPDLLVIAPDLAEKDITPPACRALLVPGRLSTLAGEIPAAWAVSYGISSRDSLTLSSLGEASINLALQREVVTLTGDCLERQEFHLPLDGRPSPLHVMAAAGVQLLLGVPPEQVTLEGRLPS